MLNNHFILNNLKIVNSCLTSFFITRKFTLYLKPTLRKTFCKPSSQLFNKHPKFIPLVRKKKHKKKKLIRPFVIKKPKFIFGSFTKKRRKFITAYSKKRRLKRFSILKIFLQRNPYILVRKDYTAIFSSFFKDRLLTPLSFDFLHLAYFKLNKAKFYKPRSISKLDSYTKRIYKYTLKNYKQYKLSPYQYLFTLMKKTTHFQKVFELYNTNHLYNLQLHQLYFFQKVKKAQFDSFLDCPDYLNPNMGYLPFNKYDALKFHEYKYIQQILGFNYPVTEIHFKETHIHGKPMKTKLPRRV